MGFSAALQGRAAHEALLMRQDAELRLMETMKRSIQMKAKFDKEYAVNLATVAQQGLKIDRSDELQGSLITKSWKSYMDEIDQQAKQFKANAEFLEVVCEKISHLAQDKRKARKNYQEEHLRIAARLNHLTDEVVRKKAEYQKHLEGYKTLRTRFEEHYVKSGKSGRKLDDVRDKYQKACRKLHLTHNEYVLTIAEATEVEKDFRTVLLPGLLEHQQSIQESFILLWKNILQEAIQHSDLTSEKYREIQRRIETAINNINPSEEYQEFTEKHKTSPVTPIVFQFDENFIEDNPGKLQPGTITVDNLTVDWLRTRLNELETAVKECQEKQQKISGDLSGSGSSLVNGVNGVGKDVQKQSKDINSLRCQETQRQKLVDIIKTALSEVGCEELPSGCDDHLTVDQSFIENNISNEQPGSGGNASSSVSFILEKGADVMSFIKVPFKRKSAPHTRTPNPKPKRKEPSQPRSKSLESLSVNSCGELKCTVPQANQIAKEFTHSSSCLESSTNYSGVFTNLTKQNSNENNQSQSNDNLEEKTLNSDHTKSVEDHLDIIDNLDIDENAIHVLPEPEQINETQEIDDQIITVESIKEGISNIALSRVNSFNEGAEVCKPHSENEGTKRSISFSQTSINNILHHLKDIKFSRSAHCSATSLSHGTEDCRDIKRTSKSESQDNKPKKTMRETFRAKLLNFHSKRVKKCSKCSKRKQISSDKNMKNSIEILPIEDTPDNEFCVCEVSNISANEDAIQNKMHDCCELPDQMVFSPNRPLYEEEWFHGVLPREEVVRLLKTEGDFLVRETIRNEESQIVLSVCWNGHKHFIVQTTTDGHYRFEGPPFPSIQELIMHQYQSELPVTVKSGAILKHPVMRERWELSNDDVILLEKIGRGNFGDVYKARLKSTKQDVAVKTCRMTLPDEHKRKFLQEGRILKQYDHPNIVKLIGICVQKQPIMIVMELVPGGSLLNFLRKNSNTLTPTQLIAMCRDTAAGMRYLESKNCIHRDLAARNCLIDYKNSVKISDFGMSREEEEYIVSDGMKQIPVKWTAPEALNFGKYTSLCDVWSFGILMWEIFSKGDTPYSGMSNSRARERIDTGYRMPAPTNTPPEMYRLMLKCWATEPETRPHFDEIYSVVDTLLMQQDS